MRSRIVLDTRVSPDDRVHLVVRYSKNGRYRRILFEKLHRHRLSTANKRISGITPIFKLLKLCAY
jgi:hypothetical protein